MIQRMIKKLLLAVAAAGCFLACERDEIPEKIPVTGVSLTQSAA